MGNCWPAQIKAESPVYEIRSRRSSSSSSCSGHSHKKENGISFSSSSSSTTMFTTSQNLGDMSNRFGGSTLRAFNFNDLKAATQSFHFDNLLGEGGFGCVYKGWVNEHDFTVTKPGTGLVVAVKKLNLEGLQGHKEWLAEVYYLGQLHHPNLVKLIGFCAEDDHRLLVYEYLQRGSLDDHLFRRRRNQPLSWALRMKIVLGAAKGLVFLHVAERQVIYRDFKTSNILLDNKYNAKLSDFGLAKDGPTGDNTHVSTRILGTFGYAAPEYVATGHLTAKSDVYSFGVVLLEILTGKRAVDRNRPDGEQNLVKWAKPYVTDKRKFYRIIDSQLEGQLSIKDAHKVAALALCCLDSDAKNRPDMEEVVEFLDSFASKHSQNLLASTEPNPHSQPINASS